MLGDSAPSVLVLTVTVGFDQCIRFLFLFVFLFSLCKKKRDLACVCVWFLIKELLLMFAEVRFNFITGDFRSLARD